MSYQQVSLGTMKARLADRVEGVPYWTGEEARRAINEALRIWSAATGFWRSLYLTQTVPNDPYVALPGTLVQGAQVAWNGIPLEPASLNDFAYGLSNWRYTTTATAGAPVRPVYWARVSLSLLAIYPADAYASIGGTHSLSVNGIRSTPILVDDVEFVDLGQEQFDVLLGYAQHVLAFKVGGQTLVASYPGWLAFLKAASQMNRQFAASVFYRRLMGEDQLRRRGATEASVTSPVDEVLANSPGGGGSGQ